MWLRCTAISVWNKQRTPPQKVLINGAEQIICIRTGNAISLIILWKDSVSINTQKETLSILQEDFRFRLLDYSSDRYSVRSVSSPTNVMAANYGHFYSEQAVAEIIHSIKDSLQGRDIGLCKEEFSKLWTPEMNREGGAFVEASMFPSNSKRQCNISYKIGQDQICDIVKIMFKLKYVHPILLD